MTELHPFHLAIPQSAIDDLHCLHIPGRGSHPRPLLLWHG